MPELLNSEVAALTWLDSIAGVAPHATTLPADEASWEATGFLVVGVVGGAPDADTPVRQTLVQLAAVAVRANSQRPPWNLAAKVGELVLAAADPPWAPVQLQPSGVFAAYPPVVIDMLEAVTDLRRDRGDVGRHARFTFDLAVTWHPGVAP